jgi:hypothetical protein
MPSKVNNAGGFFVVLAILETADSFMGHKCGFVNERF